MTTDTRRQGQGRRHFLSALALLAGLALALALGIVVLVGIYEIRYADRIYPGVWVSHVDLSGQRRLVARDLLLGSDIPLPTEQVVVRYSSDDGDLTWTISPRELDLALDTEATVKRAYEVGRGASLIDELTEQYQVYMQPRVIRPIFTVYSDGVLAYHVSVMAQEVNRSTREAQLVLEGLQVQAIPGEGGREVDQGATLAALQDQFRAGGGGEVQLVVRETSPALADMTSGEEQVRQVIGAPINLEFTDDAGVLQRYGISRETLSDWLIFRMNATDGDDPSFTVKLWEAKVRDWATELAEELAKEPKDATFRFDSERSELIAEVPSEWGQELDVEETVRLIMEASTSDERVIALPVDRIKPDLAIEDAESMGVKELVAQGSTRFKGSSESRAHNIEVAASRFDGLLIPPGATFSFNEYLGEVSKETGYDESLIIFGDTTQVGIGGGVCQVSTTAFRTALLGGFPIEERWAHGYLVHWYGQAGMDATVYEPYVDLKFRNDRDHWLWVETETDQEEGTITFRFYGTSTGRTVEIIPGEEENVTPPPPPVYTEDPSLPQGTIKQVDWAVQGLDVTLERIVREGDDVLFEDEFVSNYEPWSAKYLYGPGTVLPEGVVGNPAPTPTPESSGTNDG